MKRQLGLFILVLSLSLTVMIFQNCGDASALRAISKSSISATDLPSTITPGTATLSWDANSESDLQGYKIYYGTSSDSLSNVIDLQVASAGLASPSYVLDNLSAGTYYFAVSAYNAMGESTRSNIVSHIVK